MWCSVIVSAEKNNALSEPREEETLTKKGKKKKTVHWPEEEQLKNYFYFDLDETERGNVGFGGNHFVEHFPSLALIKEIGKIVRPCKDELFRVLDGGAAGF